MPTVPDISNQQVLFEAVVSVVVTLCILALVLAVVMNFLTAQRRRDGQIRRSPVATGSMTLVLVGICLLMRFHIGVLPIGNLLVKDIVVIIGLLMLVTGTIVNVLGRRQLGRNWANQATVFADQTLVTTGLYGLVRHPLYASLMWMCYGGALVTLSWAAALATVAVFYPMMIYRAGIEEKMLAEKFPDYPAYQERVGRFFPKFGGSAHAAD